MITLIVAKTVNPAKTVISDEFGESDSRKTNLGPDCLHFVQVQERSFPVVNI